MVASVRLVALLSVVSIALLGAGAGRAVQSDRAPPSRPAKERPIFLACTSDQQLKWNQCVDGRRAGCMLLVDQSQRPGCEEKIKPACSNQLGVQC